jgi:hypothetical protein
MGKAERSRERDICLRPGRWEMRLRFRDLMWFLMSLGSDEVPTMNWEIRFLLLRAVPAG